MFTVQPLCKAIIMLLTVFVILLINILGQDVMLLVLSIGFTVWLYRYLATLKIYINDSYLIKENGKTFKHKTILMLKNISQLEIFVIHPALPSILRIRTYDKSIYLFGLNGRQRITIEYFVSRLK